MLSYSFGNGLLLGKHAKYYAPLRNLELVALEYYDVGASDIGAQLTNIMASNPDVFVVFGIEQTCCLAMKQLRERGMDKPIVGNGPIVATTLQEAFKGVSRYRLTPTVRPEIVTRGISFQRSIRL